MHRAARWRRAERVLDEVGHDLQHTVRVADRPSPRRPPARRGRLRRREPHPRSAAPPRVPPPRDRSARGRWRTRAGSCARGRAGRARGARASALPRGSSPPPPREAPRRPRAPRRSRESRSAASSARGSRRAGSCARPLVAFCSCSAISLNEVASSASSAEPSTGTGSGDTPSARLRLASATRRTGRAIARAVRKEPIAARAAAMAPAISSARRKGCQSAKLERLRAEQHEATALDVARREEIRLAVDRDRASRRSPGANVGQMLALEIRRRLASRSTTSISLVLLLEERLQPLQPREREQDVGLVLPLRDEVGLVGEVVEVRPLDGPPRQHDADGERHADRDHDDDDDREEETSAERREPPRAHGAGRPCTRLRGRS